MDSLAGRLLVVLVLVGSMTLAWWLILPDPDTDSVAESGWVVTRVIDGDTVDVVRGGVEERVRLIGIDTPERDECGYDEARQLLVDIIEGREVILVSGTADDRDQHGRLLRYIDIEGVDMGLGQIVEGHAVARYDSRTGQPHDREETYWEADAATPHLCDA